MYKHFLHLHTITFAYCIKDTKEKWMKKKVEKFIPDRVHNNKQKNQHVSPTAERRMQFSSCMYIHVKIKRIGESEREGEKHSHELHFTRKFFRSAARDLQHTHVKEKSGVFEVHFIIVTMFNNSRRRAREREKESHCAWHWVKIWWVFHNISLRYFLTHYFLSSCFELRLRLVLLLFSCEKQRRISLPVRFENEAIWESFDIHSFLLNWIEAMKT